MENYLLKELKRLSNVKTFRIIVEPYKHTVGYWVTVQNEDSIEIDYAKYFIRGVKIFHDLKEKPHQAILYCNSEFTLLRQVSQAIIAGYRISDVRILD